MHSVCALGAEGAPKGEILMTQTPTIGAEGGFADRTGGQTNSRASSPAPEEQRLRTTVQGWALRCSRNWLLACANAFQPVHSFADHTWRERILSTAVWWIVSGRQFERACEPSP